MESGSNNMIYLLPDFFANNILNLRMAKQKLVVLSGAGISAESGLRTFRDSDGLWEGYNVTDVATREHGEKILNLYLAFIMKEDKI